MGHIQLSKNISIEEQGDSGSTIKYKGSNNKTIELAFGDGSAGLYVNGEEITDSIVGDEPVPEVRTYSPIIGSADVNDNIHSLDLAVGADVEVLATPVTIALASSVLSNLYKLDTYKSIRTVKKTVGNIGVTADFNFVTDPGTAEQSIDLGVIIPAKARIIDVIVFTDAAFTNLGSLATDVGLTTGTGDLIAVADNTAANAIMAAAHAFSLLTAPIATGQHVWLNCNPTNNWNAANPVGKMSIYVTFIDVTNI